MKSAKLLSAAVALALWATPIRAFSTPPPAVGNANDGIFAAFQTHPLVGIGDAHVLAQEEDFYMAVVRDPRFARDVGNVVVEFGGAAHQDIMNRYIAGDAVPYTEFRKTWMDVAGWAPSVVWQGYVNFFAQVRAVNMGLPPEQRIHVWLGDPPIDWSKINSLQDLLPYITAHDKQGADINVRDQYAANLIAHEILAKKKKALVIYGTAHLSDLSGRLKMLLEDAQPNVIFTVLPYSGGYSDKNCTVSFEDSTKSWPTPALATPVSGTSLEQSLRGNNCQSKYKFNPPASLPPEERTKMLQQMQDNYLGIGGDALLYLGPESAMTLSPVVPDFYLDPDYRNEIGRRNKINPGKALPAVPDPQDLKIVPRPFWP